MTIVTVVSFAPATDHACIGGFEWRTTTEECAPIYERTVADCGESHKVRLLHVDVESPLTDVNAVTEELDARIDDLEFTLPAMRQHIPATTTPDRIPDLHT